MEIKAVCHFSGLVKTSEDLSQNCLGIAEEVMYISDFRSKKKTKKEKKKRKKKRSTTGFIGRRHTIP